MRNLYRSGFTIVELLIAIVIIAVLASITVVAYNGVSERSRMSVAYSFSKQLERGYSVDKFFQMSFEDNRGSGAVVPTEETGGISVYDKDTNIATTTATNVPNSTYALDYSVTVGQAAFRNSGKLFPAKSFTLSYWFKASQRTDEGHTLLYCTCGGGWGAGTSSSVYSFSYTPNTGEPSITLQSKPFDKSKWHHVAVQFDDASLKMSLYFDGISQDTNATKAAAFANSYYIDFGRANNIGFGGQLDDIKIYGNGS